ncbi:Rrf2 family transcriptional regulator [Carnobacterium gallinarum]|uniref:Rrf2 family transcriptional regulator n=1 Tax=Carnobacterium gallinarum TaxID=2749 RepID=UPI00054D3957|nr:Rrf2 family transcriptional regulator [Carnobacterium gallinarum]
MKLTKSLEQAICIMTLLATQDKEIPVTSAVINHRLNGSPTYIKKLMRKLVVKNLVTSVSGNNGGFTLVDSPKKISILQIIEAVEGNISTYPNSGLIDIVFQDMQVAANQGEIVLANVFDEADALWTNFLATQTVADLLYKTLGRNEILVLNWNELDEHQSLLQKILPTK